MENEGVHVLLELGEGEFSDSPVGQGVPHMTAQHHPKTLPAAADHLDQKNMGSCCAGFYKE